MFDFRQAKISDAENIREKLIYAQPYGCEYSVGNILGWNHYYMGVFSMINDCFVLRIKDKNLFGFPKGKDHIGALETIYSTYENCSFFSLESRECEIIKNIFPGKFDFVPTRNSFDYIYRQSDLAQLKGKKYHSKRNHIAYFEKNNNWTYEEITPESIAECIEMNEKWYNENVDRDPIGIETERSVLNFALENYSVLGFLGGILRSDGEIVAFTFGEKLNDKTFVTHFEKAYSSVRGAYPMINMLFARESLKDFEYINREDDTGSEGLRKAKLSYHPEILLEKFTAVRI